MTWNTDVRDIPECSRPDAGETQCRNRQERRLYDPDTEADVEIMRCLNCNLKTMWIGDALVAHLVGSQWGPRKLTWYSGPFDPESHCYLMPTLRPVALCGALPDSEMGMAVILEMPAKDQPANRPGQPQCSQCADVAEQSLEGLDVQEVPA